MMGFISSADFLFLGAMPFLGRHRFSFFRTFVFSGDGEVRPDLHFPFLPFTAKVFFVVF